MSSKSPSLFTLRGANSVMSTSPAQSSRCLISSQLRASPPPRPAPSAGAHQHPRSFELVAVERELQVALLQRRIDIVDFRRPGALVPQHHDAGAVAFRDDSFERAVLDRMILDVHRQPLRLRIERRSLRHRPRQQHAVVLEPEVVVQVAGEMLLHAEEAALRRPSPSRARSATRRDRRHGSGVEVKLRFCLYFSRTTASVRRLAHQPSARLDEREHDRRPQSTSTTVTIVKSVLSGIVLKKPAAQPASLLPKAFERNQTPIIRPTMRERRELGDGAQADRAEAQLAELRDEVRRPRATTG